MYIILSCLFVTKNWGCTLELNNIEPIIIQVFKGLTRTEIKGLNIKRLTQTFTISLPPALYIMLKRSPEETLRNEGRRGEVGPCYGCWHCSAV